MNHNFTTLGSRLYSPNLNDLVGLEDTQLIFFIFPKVCLYFFFLKLHLPGQLKKQMSRKLEKLTEHLLAKLHPSNFVNAIFYVVF